MTKFPNSPTSQKSPSPVPFLNGRTPSRPGYEFLIDYMLGKVIQELTFEFCQRFLKNPKDPTFPNLKLVEQMNGAARSNPQNVAEGSTNESLSSYILLTGVACGSNEELAKDFEDFLIFRHLPIWGKEDPRVRGFRKFRVFWKNSQNFPPFPNSPHSLNTPRLPDSPTEAANMILTFCQMEGFLLSRHLESLKKKHQEKGGLRENLLKTRLDYKRNKR